MTSRLRRALAFRRRRAALAAAAAAVLAAAFIALLPRVTFPATWVAPLMARAGGPDGSLEASGVSVADVNRLVFHDVRWDGTPAVGLEVTARRLEIQLQAADIIPWLPAEGGRRITVTDAAVAVRTGSGAETPAGPLKDLLPEGMPLWESLPSPGPLHVSRATVWAADGHVDVEEAEFSGAWGHGRATGRLDGSGAAGRLDLVVQDGTGWLQAAFPHGDVGALHGPLELSLLLEGEAGAPGLRWQLEARDVLWRDVPWNRGTSYRVGHVTAAGVWHAADGAVELERLRAEVADGGDVPGLPGTGAGSPAVSGRVVEAAGTVTAAGELALEVRAEGLRLPTDVPPVAAWGMSGTAVFQGRVEGTWSEPRVQGTVHMGAGTLWHQPVDGASALIAWEPGGLHVESSRIQKGTAVYRLSGHVHGPGDGLDLTLEAERGRAETLLEVLGWSHLPLTGGVEGTMRFRGSAGSVESEGELTLTAGSGWHQPFDEVAAVYRWDGDALHVQEGVFRLGGGRGSFTGSVGAGGDLDLRVDAAGFPLEGMEAVRRAGRELLAGRVDFSGRVTGTLEEPAWEGTVRGRRLHIGRLAFEGARGELALSRGAWEVRDLVLERESGARYTAAGWVDATPNLPTLVHLVVDVEEETLEDVLPLLGIRLAYPLASGRVAGRGLLVGELARPDGEIILKVSDAQLAGRPTSLNVELDLAGGLVRVRQLNLGTPEQLG